VVVVGFFKNVLGVWRCDEVCDCTVLRRGSERAENVIKLIAIELKFSLDI
jgi:hypothetical protein